MINIKKEILRTIFTKYGEWIDDSQFACQSGCSFCCTQKVTMTAIEGELIYEYLREREKEKWFAEKLTQSRSIQLQTLTTNGYARMCLQKENFTDVPDEDETAAEPCPFLHENCCAIYTVRPFGCRSFASFEKCSANGTAQLSEKILVITTVTMQVIEHVGQREYWGNMIDVLLALSDLPENKKIKSYINDDALVQLAQARMLKAEPVSGFMVMPEEKKIVDDFLHTVLTATVGTKTIGQIFNNE